MKNIFTKTLTLIAFLSLSIGVWGADKNLPNNGDLSFSWSSRTNGTFLGGETSSDGKCISDGLWEWNRKGGEGVKMVSKDGNDYCIFKGQATYNAQTRDRYHFDAGTYVFTFYYYFDESGCEYYEPEVSLSADQRHSTIIQPSAKYLTNERTGAYTKHVFVSVPATGYYYIRLISGLNNGKDERFGYWKVNIAEPCHAILFEAEDQTAWLNINKDGIEPQDGYSLKHDDGATPYGTENKNYMELGQGEHNNERLCYAFEITTATAGKLIVRSKTTAGWDMNDAKFDIWSTSMSGEGSLTWDNETYTKSQEDVQYPIKNNMWSEASVSLGNLSAGKYILAMHKCYHPMDYDYFIIQTDEEALCAGTFYTVTFDMQGHGSAIAPQSVKENGLVKKPTDPTASGWVFGGWYKETGCTNAWDFTNDKVTANITLYAKWQEGYEVAYYDGNTKLGTETVIAGQTPQQYKQYQKKINYDFNGWYNESSLSSLADLTAAINADKDFYGKWTQGLVDNMIVTGNSASTNKNGYGEGGSVTPTSVPDSNGFFNHNVWKMEYSMPKQQQSCYAGIRIDRDADYNKDYSNGATGFGFYYKTAAGQTITFCLDYGTQKKTQLPSTNGLWKYAYVASSNASNWDGSSIIIYQNATDDAKGSWTPSTLPGGGTIYTTPSTGTYYIAEICATQKTTKPEESAATYTVTFHKNDGSSPEVTATQTDIPENTATALKTISTIGWTRTGFTFAGWAETADGAKVYDDGASITLTADKNLYAKWTPISYTITYNGLKEGVTAPSKKNYTIEEAVTLAAPTNIPTGYVFDGWYVDDNKVTEIPLGSTGDKSFTAHWKLTITYNMNGHGEQIGTVDIVEDAKWNAPTAPTAYGWTFINWHIGSASGTIAQSGTWIPTAPTTLYAEWAEDLSTVWYMKGNFKDDWATKYDFVKATGHSTSQEASVTVQNLDANTNYWFQIWDNTSNHGAKDDNMIMYHNNTGWYLDGSQNVGVHTTAAGDYTFTVNFAGNNPSLTVHYPEFVTVTVNLMGHGGNYELYTSPNGTISKPADPTADDYKFWGWYANSECTTPFDFTAPITTNTTIYAKWTLWETSTYTMHLQNTEGGDKSNFIHTETSSPYYYIFDFAIPATTYSENFFVGNNGKWYNSNLGYANSKSANWWYGWLPFTNLQGKSDCKITLGSASGAIGTLRIVDNSGDDNLYISFDPQGYGLSYGTPNQEGWVNMAFTQENSGTVWNTAPVTLTADMLGKSFYVGLAKQGGGYVYSSRSDNNMVGFSNTVAFTTMRVLTKADTWRSGNLTSADAEQVGHFQIWTDNTAQNGCCHFVLHYNATFVYNNGQVNTSTEYKSCLADNTITFPTPEAKTGYTFAGWFDNSSFTGTKYDAGSEFNLTNTGSKTFYAKWTPKTSHITFNANGGKIEGNDTKVLDYTYDGSTLTLPTPNWTGHHFDGWFTETTGGTQIDNVGGTNKPSEDVEYFAHWTINQHTLTWNTDGDELTGDYTHGTVNYGTTITAPNTPTKTGYTFAGWNDGSSVVTPATTMPDNDVTYTAQWNIINYTITYYNVGVGEHSNPTSYTITSADITLSAPNARTGYEFGGWYIDSNFQTPITQITTGSHENKDIYAKWTANQHKVTINLDGGTIDDGTWTLESGSYYKMFNFGSTISLPTPTKTGFSFNGWTPAVAATMPDNDVTYTATWAEKPKVDALIVTGDVNNAENNNRSRWEAEFFEYTHPYDALFNHNVLKIKFSNISSSDWGNSVISIDNGYQSSSSTGATGFGLWYKTDAGVTSIAFCFDYNDGKDQKKTQLPGTNGAWKYVYVASSRANGWSGSNIIIWMNGTDNNAATGNWTPSTLPHSGETTYTNPSSGTLYISEIRATEITEKFMNYTVTFPQPSQGSTSAQIKDGDAITSGTKVPEGTQVIFTWEKAEGYDLVNFSDGTNTYTQNPCTLTVNSNLTITTNVDVEVTEHTLTVNAGEHGSVSPTSKQVGEGREVTITATPADGYLFDKWTTTDVDLTGQDTDNPLTITMPTKDVTLTATWKVDYCKPYLQLNCVDYDESKVTYTNDADSKAYIETHDTYATITSGGAIYLPVTLPAGTYYIKVSGRNDNGSVWMNYLTQGTGNNVTYDGDDYGKTNWHNVGSFGNSFEEKTVSWDNQGQNITLNSETKLLFGITGHTNADYEWIRIYKTSGEPFCPEMYEVNFAANPSDKATVTAQIKGETITTGTEVPENTVVVFTASNIASGYELVNWTDDSGNELAGAVASFEQKITSDTTVNANIALIQPKYAVTATASDEHGTITSGEGEYREGATVTIVTTPATNYKVGSATSEQVDDFTIDGNNVSFTMPNEAVAVTVNFVFDDVHALIITPNSDETYTFGSKETDGGDNTKFDISSVSDPTGTFDHNVLKLEYDGMSGQYAGRSISKDAAYTPTAKATGFAFWYRTEKSDDGIAFCFQKTDYNQTKWQMQATNGEWRYYYWEDNAAANYAKNANFKIYMNGEDGGATTKYNSGTYYITEIQATNVTSQEPIVPPVNLTVTKNPDEGGSVTTYPKITTGLAKGTEVTLTASPQTGYRFVNWTVGGSEVSTDAEYNYTVNANTTITANFVRVYTLVVNHDEHIASVTGEGQYAEGESVTVTATATQGYKFTKWTEDNASGEDLATTSSYTFEMPATDNYTVYANSEQDITYYRITLGECINGTIAATVGGESYDGGELEANTPVVLTPTPNEGYGFVQWQDGNTDNPRTITANAETQEITWTATFAQQFTVTATYGQPGTSVTGGGEYPTGAEVTLTANWTLASQDFTYGFKEWTDVKGINLTDEQKVSNPLTFTMPFANVSMKATFAPVECVDTFVIQCEDDNAYIPYNKQDEDLTTYPNEIPHVDGCGRHSDYYTNYHGTGYYDFKTAKKSEMYYPVDLPASTYKFEMWSAANDDKNCWMNLYIESDDANPDVVYKGVSYKKTDNVKADNYGADRWPFAISGTIENVVITSPKSVIIGLYCGSDFGAFDQIVITATTDVFCDEKDIETFTIAANEAKEIPVSGVKNLVVYEGGQATNVDDVEVFETVKYIRSITEANIDQWSTFAVPYTATKTQVSKGKVVNDIYPVWRMENGKEQAGYYFMEVLTNNNPEAIGVESRARWDMSYTQHPQKDSAYITMFPRSQSGGYFIGSEIFYIGDYESSGGVTLTGSKNAFIENGGWPEEGKPKYYYFPNSAITAIQPYDAYVLSEDGTEFVITDHPTIKPFQCYIQATTEFKKLYPRLVIRQNSGGTTDLIPVTADGWNVSGVDKIMIDEVIYIVRDGKLYSVMGQLVK